MKSQSALERDPVADPNASDGSNEPLPETAASWPFPRPPRIAGTRYRRGGAVYVWLYQNYHALLTAQAEAGFAWREVAYEAGKAICNPEAFQPPTPNQVAATWKKVCTSVRRSGYDAGRWADVNFPGERRPHEFPPLPPAPAPASQSAAAILQAARRQSGGRRSPVYAWMQANYAELRAATEQGSPNWNAIALALDEAGLTDRDGNPPTPDTVAQTWYRLCKVKKPDRVARGDGQPPDGVQLLHPPTVNIGPRPPGPSPGTQPPRTAPHVNAGTQPAPANATDVEARLRAFRAGLNAGKVRIPEPINPAMPKGNSDGETR